MSVTTCGLEPEYIKVYLQDITCLAEIPRKHTKILSELLSQATSAGSDLGGMIIVMSAGYKRIIVKKLGLSEATGVQQIDNALHDLTSRKVLKRIETGVYQLNPYLFGKGNWKDIYKLRLDTEA